MESSKESSIAKHISDLPEEVMIRILENLDGSEVMNATLVCKYFNRTISTSARLMNKIVLKLQKDIRPNNDRAISSLTITRQYKNVSMEDDNYSWLERLRTVEAEKLFTAIATSLENSLTTIKFNKISGFTKIPQNIPIISSCKFLETLIIENCYCSIWDEPGVDDYESHEDYLERFCHESQHQRSDFNNLRQLQLINSSPIILNFIGCNQLDKLELDPLSKNKDDNERESFWKFLDQLERCDELNVEIRSSYWSGEIRKLKFEWNKLKLSLGNDTEGYRFYDRNGLRRIGILCQASSPNAEAEIRLKYIDEDDYDSGDQLFGVFLKLILNNCSKIVSLALSGESLVWSISSENDRVLQNMLAIKKLEICPGLLKDRNFVNLAIKLHNVTELKLLYDCRGVKLSTETLLKLQPLFDQITDLTVPANFMEGSRYATGVNHIKKIQFNNLQSISIEFWASLWKKTVVLRKFAQRHPTLRHLNIFIGASVQKNDFPVIVKLYNQLHTVRVTGISTCNVMIYSTKHQIFINWRSHPNLREINIFGKILSENENRFFV